MLDRLYKADHADSHDARHPVFNPKLPLQDSGFPRPMSHTEKVVMPEYPTQEMPLVFLWHCLPDLSHSPSKEQMITFHSTSLPQSGTQSSWWVYKLNSALVSDFTAGLEC